jgi:hypothetical protein
LRPLRGLDRFRCPPTAHAVGYVLSLLRSLGPTHGRSAGRQCSAGRITRSGILRKGQRGTPAGTPAWQRRKPRCGGKLAGRQPAGRAQRAPPIDPRAAQRAPRTIAAQDTILPHTGSARVFINSDGLLERACGPRNFMKNWSAHACAPWSGPTGLPCRLPCRHLLGFSTPPH